MLPLGINVCLAVDGSASNDSSDMLGEIRTALLLQRVHYGAAAITATQVVKIATENGARLLNYPKTGKIREGWAADIAIFNIGKLEYCGAHSDPLAALIFSGYNHGAEYTIVNGSIVVDKGTLTRIDEAELTVKCNDIADKLMKQR
jgi:cytosine/adenosine deaminase-related metal-dependent hydrolase